MGGQQVQGVMRGAIPAPYHRRAAPGTTGHLQSGRQSGTAVGHGSRGLRHVRSLRMPRNIDYRSMIYDG